MSKVGTQYKIIMEELSRQIEEERKVREEELERYMKE
jgi:hypothetical protein